MGRRDLTHLIALVAVLAGACGGDDESEPKPKPVTGDPDEFAKIQKSCAYDCPIGDCAEVTTSYACHNLERWLEIPHADTCEAWNGKYPKAVAGKCTVSEPTSEAAKYAGPDPGAPGTYVMPDGRRLAPAGDGWVFDESDTPGGNTTGMIAIPNTTLIAVVDTGFGPHVVRLVDSTLFGKGKPVTSYVVFPDDQTLNSGMAFIAPDLLYVASADGAVYALTLDIAQKKLTRDDARMITLPASAAKNGKWYASGLAASPDGKRLLVSPVLDQDLLVFDVDPASPSVRQLLGSAPLGIEETFSVAFDPNDPAGTHAYVTLWKDAKLVEVDLSNAATPTVSRSFATTKDPQGIAFIDARWMLVSGDLGDRLTLIDRTAGTTVDLPIDADIDQHGLEPSALAYDASSKRLYVALSGMNAVGVYSVDAAQTPPAIKPIGRIPTGWWPSAVSVLTGGAVAIANMRGQGEGPNAHRLEIDNPDGEIADLSRGGIQRVAFLDAQALTDGEARVHANNRVSELDGRPTVSCPDGVTDFPVPETNEGGSPVIRHVFFVVRENKNFDALFGDLEGVEGRADLTLKEKPEDMEAIWKNLRTLARTFTVGDNYYTAADQSTQGHVWTTYGRSNDFNERTWAISGSGHNARAIPGGGVIEVGRPVEGSLFDWLGQNDVGYDIFGEIVGQPEKIITPTPIDVLYPGGPFQNIGYNDLEKACYLAGRLRVKCNTRDFSYITLPNDHTFGISAKNPTPETFCAVNDQATGMLVDAISHSPLWASSLIVITEDDPIQGGEHIDSHRTPLVLVSPWIKRGYVSRTHIDTASLHKLFAHVFGKPYRNYQVANAALPLDAFSSKPDYTPYTYTPRTWPLACGDTASSAEALVTDSWDFSDIDDQPGLGAQVARFMRNRQLTRLTPAQHERVLRRLEQKHRKIRPDSAPDPLPAGVDDDDD